MRKMEKQQLDKKVNLLQNLQDKIFGIVSYIKNDFAMHRDRKIKIQRLTTKRYKMMISTIFLSILILSIEIFLTNVSCQLAELFDLATVSVKEKIVGAKTTLEFELQIRRSSGTQIDDGDVLAIQLPTDTGAMWDTASQPTCFTLIGGSFRGCRIISKQIAQITLNAQAGLTVRGIVSNFVNPPSTRGVFNIICSIRTRKGAAKLTSAGLDVDDFLPAGLDVALASSSAVFGAQNQILTIALSPQAKMLAVGKIIVQIPEYYYGARSDYMFSQRDMTSCTCSSGTVQTCQFNSRLMQLMISYSFSSKQDYLGSVLFTVPMFNNPLVPAQGGFHVSVFDSQEFPIQSTESDVTITGVSEPAVFQSWDFGYVDMANSAQYAVHSLLLVSSIPVQYGCRLTIKYPSRFTVNDRLVSLDGSGFFAPDSGSLRFTVYPDTNTVEVIACKQNYGKTTSGTLYLSRVLNQPYVQDITESFKVIMTTENDRAFRSPYQYVDYGWTVPAEQQAPGAMGGSIKASSLLVQTFTVFDITLTPTIDLDQTAFLLITIPDSLDFQGPSCTISGTKGLSASASCNREYHTINITNPFDSFRNASIADPVYFVLEEFLLPTGVQPLGDIEVTSWDIRDGAYYPLDIKHFDQVSTVSGAITKLSEVTVSSTITGLPDQTFGFSFKADHKVPVGGAFSILLSEDLTNGVKVSNAILVKNNCFLVGGQTGPRGLACKSGTLDSGRPFVNISCSAGIWPQGTNKGDSFSFTIGGLRTPRTRNYGSYFTILTLDEQARIIDSNAPDQQFSVMMTDLQGITSVYANMDNGTNGALATYTLTVVPSMQVATNDTFRITFPAELTLPPQPSCSSSSVTLIASVDCTLFDKATIAFILRGVSDQLIGGSLFNISVSNVRNAASTRPTSLFTDIVFIDSISRQPTSEYQIATRPQIRVRNTQLGQLNRQLTAISQSSYAPLENSTVYLSFNTNNPLPNQASITVVVPNSVTAVYNSPSDCWIQINGQRIDGACTITGYQVLYKEAFVRVAPGWSGQVQLAFKTMNPKDNILIKTQAYSITIYDDAN